MGQNLNVNESVLSLGRRTVLVRVIAILEALGDLHRHPAVFLPLLGQLSAHPLLDIVVGAYHDYGTLQWSSHSSYGVGLVGNFATVVYFGNDTTCARGLVHGARIINWVGTMASCISSLPHGASHELNF